jgi:hypothetical protein
MPHRIAIFKRVIGALNFTRANDGRYRNIDG